MDEFGSYVIIEWSLIGEEGVLWDVTMGVAKGPFIKDTVLQGILKFGG